MTRRPPSLFLRLLVLTLPVEAAVLALFGVWLVRGIERRDLAAFDADLRVRSKEILGEPVLDDAGRLRLDADLLRRDLATDQRACLLDGSGGVLWEAPPGWFAASGLRPSSQPGLEYLQTLVSGGSRTRVLDAARRLRLAADGDVATGPLVEVVLASPLARLERANSDFREKAAAAGLALLGLTVVLLWTAIRLGLSPVRALMEGLRGVPGPEGRERLDAAALPLELRPLAEEINGLSERLWGLVQLEKRFTAEAAHELRTPLTLVKSTLQTALLTGRSARDHEGALREALEDLQRLEQTAESLLALARADALLPAQGPPLEDVDLADVLSAVAERFAPTADQRGLALTVDLAPCVVPGDRSALEHLVLDLADNAVKYSKAGGTVTLRCSASGGAPFAAVEDDGPSIPEADRPHLFQPFFRGGTGRAGPVQGAGLGLAIASSVARRHGAELVYEPLAGGGNRFLLRFPS